MTPLPELPGALFDPVGFRAELAEGRPLPKYKAAIERARNHLDDAFRRGEPVRELVQLRAAFVDELLRVAWEQQRWPDDRLALVAVGGYGRAELHPYSDIDLLILLPDDSCEHCRDQVEAFITLLWDMNLNIGHSVRSVAQCQEAAAADITIATNLMESRLLAGPLPLFEAMRAATGPDKIWPSRDFFRAKWDEQLERHR